MKIYLIRHAAAVPASATIPDSQRYLSAEGRHTCRGVGRVLREAGVSFDAVMASPFVRAVQTAELLASAVDYLGVISAHTSIIPGAQPQIAMQEILRQGADAVAVVGHEPSISELAAFLIGQPGFAPFRPGQVSFFEDRRPVWKVHPEALQLQDLHAT